MAEKRLFHLRKHLNAVHRLSFPRAYSGASEEAKQLTTPEQQVAFLRAADQRNLQEARDSLDALLANAERMRHYIDSIPTQVKLHNSPVPPYTWTLVRNPEQYRTAFTRLHAAGAHVRGHFTDLLESDYPDKDEDVLSNFRQEVEKMPREQQEEMLKDLQMQEEAGLQRLKAENKRLEDEVKRLDGGTVEDPWMHGNVAEKEGVKTSGGRRGRRERASKRAKSGSSGEARRTGPRPASTTSAPAPAFAPAPASASAPAPRPASRPAPSPAPAANLTASLADLQAQLEATGFKNGL